MVAARHPSLLYHFHYHTMKTLLQHFLTIDDCGTGEKESKERVPFGGRYRTLVSSSCTAPYLYLSVPGRSLSERLLSNALGLSPRRSGYTDNGTGC